MAVPLMKSTSGIRGIVGESLVPPLIVGYASAFAQLVNRKTVVVGRDSRPSGQFISSLVTSALAMAGCRVVDLGIVPTPTVELAVTFHKAAGGIAITASHNPSEWNALKFFSGRGEFITREQYLRLESLVESGKASFALYKRLGSIAYDTEAISRHIRQVGRISALQKAQIRKAGFRVVVDAVNGAGSSALPDLLEYLGAKVIRLNCKGDGNFTHKPEPVPRNLKELGQAVTSHRAHLGMACDPDADRLALVDNTGRAIGEELTLALTAAYYLIKNKGPVVINLSTSRVTADIARMVGSRVYYSRVGEANVIEEMRRRKAVIGGEGNGGVILPEIHYGRDSLVGAALILSYLAETGKALSELAGTVPPYTNIKRKAPLPGGFEGKISRVEKELSASFEKIVIDRRDGIRIDLEDSWVQVRKSNTEPIYRLIVESKSKARAGRLAGMVQKILS